MATTSANRFAPGSQRLVSLAPPPPLRGRGEKRTPHSNPSPREGRGAFRRGCWRKGTSSDPGARGPTVNLHPTHSGGKTAGPRESLGPRNSPVLVTRRRAGAVIIPNG